MAESFLQFAFSAGVISESLLYRKDLTKYDLGLRKGKNWFIDYRGGASTRPGLEFCEPIEANAEPTRLFSFKFNTSLGNNIVIVFSDGNIRFVQDGQYLTTDLSTLTNLTNSTTPTATFTSAHGLTNGDWIKIPGTFAGGTDISTYTFEVANVTSNTAELLLAGFASFDTTSLGAFTPSASAASKVYTITNPYATADFALIDFQQDRDVVYLTHPDYAPRTLTRTTNTSWAIAEIDYTGNEAAIANLTHTSINSSTRIIAYGVTAVDYDGQESLMADPIIITDGPDMTQASRAVHLEWDAVTDTDFYRVYRTIVTPSTGEVTFGNVFGYLGMTETPSYQDNDNTIPDFTVIPPLRYNPFAHGAVQHINVTGGGSAYVKDTTTVSITSGTGSGFEGLPVVDNSGALISVRVLNGGEGYIDSDTVVITSGVGSGATATLTVTEASGNNPRCSVFAQQRRYYGGPDNQPLTMFASRIGAQDNFDYTRFPTVEDSFELAIDAEGFTPIKYMQQTPTGIFVFTESSVYLAYGADTKIMSSETARAEPQIFTGIADVRPLTVQDSYLFLELTGSGVTRLAPGQQTNSYQAQNLSLFSGHFFDNENQILAWDFAKTPHRLLWAVRENGTALSMTFVPSQEVFAWTDHQTAGNFKDVVTVFEDTRDVAYFAIERSITGVNDVVFLERTFSREFTNVEDMYAVDCGHIKTLTTYAATITATAAEGDSVTVTASAGVFPASITGHHLRFAGGRALVTARNSSTEIVVDWEIPATELYHADETLPKPAASGEWTLDDQVTGVYNLHHLEGMTVDAFADGRVETGLTVSDGAVTLSAAASKVVIGLPYTADLRTLPLTSQSAVLENRRQRIVGAAVRTVNSRGFSVGGTHMEEADADITVYPIKEPAATIDNAPTDMSNRLFEISIAGSWSAEQEFVVKKTDPVHATVIGIVLKAEIGDD